MSYQEQDDDYQAAYLCGWGEGRKDAHRIDQFQLWLAFFVGLAAAYFLFNI